MAAVRKLFGWMAGLVGIAALARILRPAAPRRGSRPDADRAARSRSRRGAPPQARRDARGAASGGRDRRSTTAAPEPTETLEERRARVHAKAQEAIDAMDALQEPPT